MDQRSFEKVTATSMKWLEDGGIAVSWSDGHQSVFSRPYLRAMCPCASCQGTHGPPTTLVDARQPKAKPSGFNIMTGPKPPPVEVALELRGAEPVGRYGMKLTWGDGHDTGIYTWRYLRTVSPGDGTDAHPPTEAALAARLKARDAAGL